MIGLLRKAIVRLVHQGEGKSENYFRSFLGFGKSLGAPEQRFSALLRRSSLLAGDQGRDYVWNTGDPIPFSMSLRGAFKGSSLRLYFVFNTENHKKNQSNAMAQM